MTDADGSVWVVETESVRTTRRRRALLVVSAVTALLGAGAWLLLPDDGPADRASLAADEMSSTATDDVSGTSSSLATDPGSDVGVVDATTADTGDRPLLDPTTNPSDSGGVDSDLPTTSVDASPGGDSFTSIYESLSCTRYSYVEQPCLGALNAYCASHSIVPWSLPNMLGRRGDRPLTANELDAAWVYGFCKLGHLPSFVFNQVTTCTHDPAQVGLIAAQEPNPGTSLERYEWAYPRLTTYRDCGPTTTCVMLTEPTDLAWPDPPTSVLYCE